MRKVFACSAAVVASTLAIVAAAPVTAAPAPAPQSVSWSADPVDGVGAFNSIQCADGHFKTADSVKGKVWVAEQLAQEERCEAVGPDLAAGKTFYLGWSSKYRITDSTSRYVFQLKCSPSDGTANHPIVLKISGGRLQLEEWTTDHTSVKLWSAPVSNDQWHDIAFRIFTDRTQGTIQFWFDGQRQTFSDGSTTYTGTTIDGTRNYLKWGVYHQADQTATQWLTKIRMGDSLADVTG
ncbi:heparin lyase I family protein [Amycolatopsis sp. VS8301801F10]|uniref:heparin lyase I family protein n=1 Tax=Amycolatopsis sp. VS8301801F10 TaxID=2652442 RepID=UPI0038FD0748